MSPATIGSVSCQDESPQAVQESIERKLSKFQKTVKEITLLHIHPLICCESFMDCSLRS